MASRSGFSSRIGFVAAAAGAAVGLGNIWRFPYETGENGGAVFLLIYLLCTILIGFPVMLGEIAIGRNTSLNPYGAYKKLGGKRWALVGLFGVFCGVAILSFYNVVAGWAFGYFIQIGFGGLLEIDPSGFGGFFGEYIADFSDNMLFSLIFMALTAFIVLRGVQSGIELASKILMPFLFILLAGLIIYALTLDNAMAGVTFYLLPEFSEVSFETVYSAMGQAFFSLSLGMGTLITYGSYLNKKENLVSAAGIVTAADVTVAFLAGLMIFPLVFSQNMEPTAGPGLVFVVLPAVFQSMGAFGTFIGATFFLLLSVAALTSTISLLEVPVAYVTDEHKVNRITTVIGLALLSFLVGVPSMLSQGGSEGLSSFISYGGETRAFMDMVEDLFLNVGLPLGGFLMSVFIATQWKTQSLSAEIASGNPNYEGSLVQGFVNLMITYVCPIVLGLIFVITVLQKFLGIQLPFL
ncbi:MAG: sodium-dependent transporter [Bacteroidota bacterium]